VSVIVAALADGTIPAPNQAPSLDLLGGIVAGHSDETEVAAGVADVRDRCHAEAVKGYWALIRVACSRDPFNAQRVAADVLSVLDGDHAERFLV
jgi:hypothetical protein